MTCKQRREQRRGLRRRIRVLGLEPRTVQLVMASKLFTMAVVVAGDSVGIESSVEAVQEEMDVVGVALVGAMEGAVAEEIETSVVADVVTALSRAASTSSSDSCPTLNNMTNLASTDAFGLRLRPQRDVRTQVGITLLFFSIICFHHLHKFSKQNGAGLLAYGAFAASASWSILATVWTRQKLFLLYYIFVIGIEEVCECTCR